MEREQLRRRLGWLYNGVSSSMLIAGLFNSMHNAIVNSTGLVAVVGSGAIIIDRKVLEWRLDPSGGT